MRRLPENKYALLEWERRFLLDRFPSEVEITRVRGLFDRYIDGTNLRLRRQVDKQETQFKLTQKLRGDGAGALQGLITNLYLTESEFHLLEKLPAKLLQKTRYSVPPFGIDVFENELQGLVLAEAEFNSAEEAANLALPSFMAHEVTTDLRFTGGELVRTSRQELNKWLEEFGMRL